jgi:hypothetical protein
MYVYLDEKLDLMEVILCYLIGIVELMEQTSVIVLEVIFLVMLWLVSFVRNFQRSRLIGY